MVVRFAFFAETGPRLGFGLELPGIFFFIQAEHGDVIFKGGKSTGRRERAAWRKESTYQKMFCLRIFSRSFCIRVSNDTYFYDPQGG